ncbi:hypothetical protein GGR53DRAFT_188210 [Hypoxylon sp. FL1150]|nr:hypothetical protein GGR53DRAFT_188210 [Hypoxylon sp. FL1150]
MPPKYQGFTLEQAIKDAGDPPPPETWGWKHVYDGEPPVSFFTDYDHIPLLLAIFSTEHGTKPFRNVENPTFERDFQLWSAQKIQDTATELRRDYFGLCKYIRAPQSYDELYCYWDAHDIYYLGAQNLWNVLHHMHFESQLINKELQDETAPWIEQYVSEVLVNDAAREKLKQFSAEDHGDILSYFGEKDLPELEGLEVVYHDTLRDILMSNCMRLRRGGPVEPQYRIDTQPFQGAYGSRSTYNGKYLHSYLISYRLPNSSFTFPLDVDFADWPKAEASTNAGST